MERRREQSCPEEGQVNQQVRLSYDALLKKGSIQTANKKPRQKSYWKADEQATNRRKTADEQATDNQRSADKQLMNSQQNANEQSRNRQHQQSTNDQPIKNEKPTIPWQIADTYHQLSWHLSGLPHNHSTKYQESEKCNFIWLSKITISKNKIIWNKSWFPQITAYLYLKCKRGAEQSYRSVKGDLGDILKVKSQYREPSSQLTLDISHPHTWVTVGASDSPFQPITLRGKAPTTQKKIFPAQFLPPYLTFSGQYSQAIRQGLSQSAFLREYTEECGCDGNEEPCGRKVSSVLSYLAPFDQEERWIRKDSPEVST